MRINTEIENIIVEIDDSEYEVTPKTIEIAENLADAQRRCKGKPEYMMWLAELEVLLGKPAVQELFCSGRQENIDRIQRIHAGVLRAFEYNSDVLSSEKVERATRNLAPVSDVLRQVLAVQKQDAKKVVHRGTAF